MSFSESRQPTWIQKRLLRFLRAGMNLAFHLLYYPFAFAYDAVAWVVSAGEWADWRRCVLPFLKPGPVLEVAHGTGSLALDMANAGYAVTALDLSPAMSRIAAGKRRAWLRRHPSQAGPNLLRAKVFPLPFGAACFTNIVSTFPADFIFDARMFTEAHRCLAPGGRLIIIPTASPEWLAARSSIFAGETGSANTGFNLFRNILPPDFRVRVEIVRRARSRVLVLIAEKPAAAESIPPASAAPF
jgi:ubiquinone/menaquinone biosynthesis C-methylase UbiE